MLSQSNLLGLFCLFLSACHGYQSSNIIFSSKNINRHNDWSRLHDVVPTRRGFVTTSISSWIGTSILLTGTRPAHSIGPVKVDLKNPTYFAVPCPPNKPIPGEKAMKGLRGLCVTVRAELTEPPPKELEKVGVYGFVKDGDSGDSVLANNPDLSTDAGQFSMIESVTPTDTQVTFEFIAAIPMERDLSLYDNGIGPLDFSSLRIISYPGGQQYGAINPCEMNEFSDECDAWVEENGTYEKGKYMMESNKRTKGR
jgi:hypothetical protein